MYVHISEKGLRTERALVIGARISVFGEIVGMACGKIGSLQRKLLSLLRLNDFWRLSFAAFAAFAVVPHNASLLLPSLLFSSSPSSSSSIYRLAPFALPAASETNQHSFPRLSSCCRALRPWPGPSRLCVGAGAGGRGLVTPYLHDGTR